jgi:hypothetical protein
MASDDASETRDRAEPLPYRRRTPIGRISQLVLATFYFAAGTILTMELLGADTVTRGRQILLAGLIGLMLLLACIHIAVFWRGLKLRKGRGSPASQPS